MWHILPLLSSFAHFLDGKPMRSWFQSELPRSIPWNSVESDLGCTSSNYFDNVTLTIHNVTLTSQKLCQYNNKSDCSETNRYNSPQNAINEVKVFLRRPKGRRSNIALYLQFMQIFTNQKYSSIVIFITPDRKQCPHWLILRLTTRSYYRCNLT